MSQGAPVWSKRVGDASVADANVKFCAGYDVAGRGAADSRLAPFDLQTNAAHLLMLEEREIIPQEPAAEAASGLLKLKARLEGGEDLLRPSCEDIHMSVESLLTELVGADAGGRIHTGRSRNDQIATDMRLWLRDTVAAFAEDFALVGRALATHARQHLHTVCPGFTHGQPGMVTSWGHTAMSYMPRILRDLRALAAILRELSTCPLGAAAGYGTGWPIDRNRTATLLGFKHPSPSGADSNWSRGEMEGRLAVVLAQFLSHLAGIGQDIILLSSPPRDWLRLADEHVTGSSIMPQKRNPDFAEVTRARAAHALGIAQGLLGISSVLPSGYNRDTQWTKYLAFDAADNALHAGPLFADVFDRVRVNAPAMRAACDVGFLNATDVADYIARSRRIPFRACYRLIGAAVKECESAGRLTREAMNPILAAEQLAPLSESEWQRLEDPAALLMLRAQPGNPHPDETAKSIDILLAEIEEERALIAGKAAEWRAAIDRLWGQVKATAGE